MAYFLNRFPHYPQVEFNDCGIACLKMIFKFYGRNCDLSFLRKNSGVTKSGISVFDIKRLSQEVGFDCEAVKTSLHGIVDLVYYPCILHWEQNHFVVLYRFKNGFFYIADPNFGRIKLKKEEFEKFWLLRSTKGIAILLKPTEKFYNYPFPNTDKIVFYKNLKKYLKKIFVYQQSQLLYLLLLLIIGGTISYIYPLSIEYLVDKALGQKNMHLVIGVILFQLALNFSGLVVEALKGAVKININQKVSINIFKDLLTKLISLPLSYFDGRKTADILQKIEEQRKIELFITENLFGFSVSLVLLLGFSIQIFLKNSEIGLIFIGGTVLSILIFLCFTKQRNTLNYYNLKLQSENRNLILETIKGIIPIKLFNAESTKVSHWLEIQDKIIDLRKRLLRSDTLQLMSSNFVNQLRTLVINFYCCIYIINNRMTLGEMVSIGAILGVLNAPIQSIYQLIRSYSESILSFQKINEIYVLQSENATQGTVGADTNQSLKFINVSFSYPGASANLLLKNVTFEISKGKTTAIVGESGSGKTTLTKLIGLFYKPETGTILYGKARIDNFDVNEWRNKVGVVAQDGYIFSGTIGENIALNKKINNIQIGTLNRVSKIACIYDFISTLPLGYDTIIGDSGLELSAGQRQRVLIARALYSDPEIIIFDEATSNLDALTESSILKNLSSYLDRRTVIIIAHRLSTVQHADHIIALKEGIIVEEGSHSDLLLKKNYYHDLWEKQTLSTHEIYTSN
ncbi:peptidase domain-containing ABC transporter [Sphingobacterium daejeonense]|uniref:peptidase domain-containing ABC transporter n=1 Tax=Sphingobacterium daejeonense TaxID=371142 RepID=UPI0021A82E75|nr:peptidase domain-containing ABC transporter [Sphingobacterium daejeonense]MCT1531336.1 peptidase domain-containing ABC transporter [Sphingobacterium daejeonense]